MPAENKSAASLPTPAKSGSGEKSAYHWLNRLTWGANTSLVQAHAHDGRGAFIAQQLSLSAQQALPPKDVQVQIQAMTISQRPLQVLAIDMDQRRKDAEGLTDEDARKAALQAYQQEMNRLAREAARRHVLRALYSPAQIHAQMSWFWLNHFSVSQNKANLRAMVGDYEESAIRPHALGKFKDLLSAVARHPVMLRYLDNDRNAAGRINENYARELMELHTLGVDGGYSQRDVQELARVLTGVGVSLSADNPAVRKELQTYYVRQGLFEFHPGRHDFGDKVLLGEPIRSKGLAELNEALTRLSRQLATAHFISHKLTQFWLTDTPPAALVARMADAFQRSDGDIAQTLWVLFNSAEFASGEGQKFKDPMRYVISAVRLAYDDKAILNAGPVLNWLDRLGEPLFRRQTPDGYPLTQSAWASPGQMATRFEVAKAIGSGTAGLFKGEGAQAVDQPAFPQLSNALYFQSIEPTLSVPTRRALYQANSSQEWNTFLLSSPEMMSR